MFEKGQHIAVEELKGNPSDRAGAIYDGVVTIVGRKYYTVDFRWWERRFDKETLDEVTEIGGPTYRLFPTEQAVWDDRERERLHWAIRKIFESFSVVISLDKLKKIDTILKDEDGDD